MARTPTKVTVDTPAAGPINEAFAPVRIDTNEGMFGGQQARALGGLGNALIETGSMLSREVIAEQQIKNETEATNAQNEYQQEAGRLWGEYSALQGEEAVRAYPAFQENMRQLQRRMTESATNPVVRRQLTRSIGGSASSMLGQAAGVNARNVRTAGVQAQEGSSTLAINEGVRQRDNPQAVQEALNIGLQAVQQAGRLTGADADTVSSNVAAYRGRFWSAVIATTAENDPLRAQQMFEQNRNQMDAQAQIRIENFLRAPVRDRRADDIVQWATAPRGPTNPAPPGAPGNRQGGVPAAADPNTVRDQVSRAEGGTDAAGQPIQNRQGSSAFGPLQVTRGTWNAYADRLGLQRDVQGQPPPANRGDRETQNRIWDLYQADARQQIGRDLTPREQYTAWFLGIAGAKSFIMADPNADAFTTYSAAAGPDIAAQAFRQNGALLRTGMTVQQATTAIGAYFDRHGGGGNPQAGTGRPGREQQMGAALERAGSDPDLRAAVLSRLRQQWGIEDTMNSAERSRMDRRVEALGQALALGTSASIPEADIRRLYQPEQAQAILDGLATRQIEGDVFRSVQLATPQQIVEMQQDLADGSGPITRQLRERRGVAAGANGEVAEEDRPGDAVARQQLATTMQRAVEARGAQLQRDPAQYVMADPVVRAAAQAQQADPSNPAMMSAYVEATLAAQARLGVAEQNRRVLSVNVAAAEAARLMGNDPGGGTAQNPDNAALRLQAMRRQYGSAWPQVFGDLVRDGRLPPEYQVLANIPTPVGQADYQRTLNGIRARGGLEQFAAVVPRDQRRLIDDGLDRAIEPFRSAATAGQQTGGVELTGHIRDAVRNLSYYYAIGGMSGADALRAATDRIFNDKYEFSGTMRVPRRLDNGQEVGIARVNRSASVVLRGLRPEDMAAPESIDPALTENDRRQNLWNIAQRGVWVPNQDDTGLVLMGTWEMGGRVPVRRRDGSVIEMRFDNLPEGQTTIPGAGRRGGNPGQRAVQPIEGWNEGPDAPGQAPRAPQRPVGGPAPVEPNAPVAGTQATPRLNSPASRGSGRWVAPGVEQ